jgi:ribonuclease E
MDDAEADAHEPAETSHASAEDIPGVGEQPPVSSDDDREDRRGRRRRRGRRGGRRGRDREASRSEETAAHEGNGAADDALPVEAAAEDAVDRHEPPQEQPADRQPPEPAMETASEARPEPRHEALPEPAGAEAADASWRESTGPGSSTGAEPEMPHRPEPHRAVPELSAREAVHVEPVQEDDDPSRPVRKGWWQRRFSGE